MKKLLLLSDHEADAHPLQDALQQCYDQPVQIIPQNTDAFWVEIAKAVADGVARDVVGCLFMGGTDVNPEIYGQQPHPETGASDRLRDGIEAAVHAAAAVADIPSFGICRGSQFLSVMHGGVLKQHIEGHAIHGTHEAVVDTTEMGYINMDWEGKTSWEINSTHHQAAPDASSNPGHVIVTGTDGTTEATVYADGLGVQWHPEYCRKGQSPYDLYVELVKQWWLSRL